MPRIVVVRREIVESPHQKLMRRSALLLLSLSLSFAACKKDEKTKDEPPPAQNDQANADETKVPAAGSDEPAANADTSDALLERGAYLMALMGCENCHTPFGANGAPDSSKAYAGGLEIPESFGTWRSPNITQDKETGIGAWTDEQIIAAIREGKRPDGEGLFPIMPYPFYNTMSDDDAKAMVAYLRNIPAISNVVERTTELKLPKIPVPPAKGDAPDTSDPVAHGGYLASLMHCAVCHTPMGPQGLDMSKAFAGGMKLEIPMLGEGALYTANLTPDEKTGIGTWTDDEIIAAVKQMKKRDGSIIMPPMAMYQKGWFSMTDKDAKDLVAFLRSLPPIENEVPKSTFKPNGGPPGAH